MPSNTRSSYMNVARIVRTHGKRGEVVVAALDGLPFALRAGMRVCLTPPALKAERFRTVASVTQTAGWPLVAFEGVSTIGDAEELVGKLVLARRDEVPEAARERDVVSAVGREVTDAERGSIGTVAEVMQLPANDVWRVEGPYGEVLLPVIDDVVGEIPAEGPIAVHVLPGLMPQEEGR